MPTKRGRDTPRLSFQLSLATLAVIAFAQLIGAAVALAARVEQAREVRVEERVVTKIVTVEAERPSAAAPEPPATVALPPPPPQPAEVPLPPPRPLDAPPIADPVVARLVDEAREARVAEDMGSAIVKLEEARERSPNEPNVLYELGLVYETMAAYDTALAQQAALAYQRVFELGTEGAGALYPLAAAKLRDGIARPLDMRGKLSLGRVRIFRDEGFTAGQRVILTIPVHAAPGAEPEADDFFVEVHFFDKTPQGEPTPKAPGSSTEVEWVSGAIDWLGGEEQLRVTYTLPPADPSQDHLFGRREYYGQVVELVYKNELIDSQAWPRHLASLLRSEPDPGGALDPLFLDQDLLPPDFDPNLPLLPPLEDELPIPPDP